LMTSIRLPDSWRDGKRKCKISMKISQEKHSRIRHVADRKKEKRMNDLSIGDFSISMNNRWISPFLCRMLFFKNSP